MGLYPHNNGNPQPLPNGNNPPLGEYGSHGAPVFHRSQPSLSPNFSWEDWRLLALHRAGSPCEKRGDGLICNEYQQWRVGYPTINIHPIIHENYSPRYPTIIDINNGDSQWDIWVNY